MDSAPLQLLELTDLDSLLADLPTPEPATRLPEDQAAVVDAFDQLLTEHTAHARRAFDQRVDELLRNHRIPRRPRRRRDLIDLLIRDVLVT